MAKLTTSSDIGAFLASLNNSAARTSLGSTTIGDAIFIAPTESAFNSAVGLRQKERTVIIEDDFYTTASPGAGMMNGSVLNLGSTQSGLYASAQHPGALSFRNGAAANSGYRIITGTSAFVIGGSEEMMVVFRSDAALSTQVAYLGFHTAVDHNAFNDGVYLELDGNGTGIVVSGRTAAAGSRSTTASTYTSATGTWYSARIAINAAKTLVTFTLYSEAGSVLWTDTLATNIPTANVGFGVLAFEGTNTTPANIFTIDYLRMQILRTLTR